MKKKIFEAALHFVAIGAIILAFLPLARWYFGYTPLWGVDFYYTATLTKLLKEGFALPPAVWNHSWFSGSPFLSSYPILHYYFILPITFFLDLFASVKIWMLTTALLFFVGSYFVFYSLSQNRILSTALAVASIYSVGFYGSLMWGGSLPNFASQAFFPWVLLFAITHLQTGKNRFLLLASLVAGLAIWGHPQIVIAYIYPAVGLVYLLSFKRGTVFTRAKHYLTLLGLSLIVGLPLISQNLGTLKVLFISGAYEVGASTVTVPANLPQEAIVFFRSQPLRILTDTQPVIFVLLALVVVVYLASLVFRSVRSTLAEVFPFLVMAAWFTFYIWIFSYGISILHGGWYRLFWTVPVYMGMLTAVLWGSIARVMPFSISAVFSTIFLVLALLFFLRPGSGSLRDITRPDIAASFVYPETFGVNYYFEDGSEVLAPGTLSILLTRSQPSSSFPDITSLKTSRDKLSELRSELVPSWLDPENTDYRLYEADQTVNIWWNAHYKMPLARGYLDPQSPLQKGYSFWVDAALNQDQDTEEHQLVGSFNYPVEVAKKNTLFLIDWYAIKYFEAGHAGPTVYSPLPEFLTSSEFMQNEVVLDFNKEKFNKGNQELHYYQLKDEFVSPILLSSNAPTLGIIASEQGYETVVRAIADANINSKRLIPIKLGNYIDGLTTDDLALMDSLFLYDYKYKNKNKAFKLISSFARGGKRVFIDTGVEVKESDDVGPLPEIFPIERTERNPLETTWRIEMLENELSSGIDFSSFAPPIFDKTPWKFSYPRSDSDIREGTSVILKNYGIAIVISQKLGEGEVIWSGMNLPYHIVRYHNAQEAKFLEKIVNSLIESQGESKPTYQSSFVSSQKRRIKTVGALGVIFKEQANPGWQANVDLQGKTQGLKIYKAGPGFPGFAYVRLPKDLIESETVVTFTYTGSAISWFYTLVSLLTILFILDYVILHGKLLSKVTGIGWVKLSSKLKRWWEREEEL